MMKHFYLILSLFLTSSTMAFSADHPISPMTSDLPRAENASTAEALAFIDLLIEATQQSLEQQKNLRLLIIEYQGIRKTSLENPHDNAQLARMIKSGHRLLEAIKESHLIEQFDPEFLGELNLLSQMATKRKG